MYATEYEYDNLKVVHAAVVCGYANCMPSQMNV